MIEYPVFPMIRKLIFYFLISFSRKIGNMVEILFRKSSENLSKKSISKERKVLPGKILPDAYEDLNVSGLFRIIQNFNGVS